MKLLKHNTNKFYLKIISILLLSILSMTSVLQGQNILSESFNYPSGTLLTVNNWAAISGTGTNNITVSTGNLAYPETIGDGIGNKIKLNNNGQDVYRTFTSTTAPIYSSLIVNVSSAGVLGDFFYSIGTSSAPATTVGAKLFIKSNGSGYSFGVLRGTGGIPIYETTIRQFNTNVMIVLKYEVLTGNTNDVIKLYVNPTSSVEPGTQDAIYTAAVGADTNAFSSIAILQGTTLNAPTLEVDAINVGTTWNSVTKAIYDYGDAPKNYDFTKDGVYAPAAHGVLSGLGLGSIVPDLELSPLSVTAEADNNGSSGDGMDEDAIVASDNPLKKGVPYILTVPVTNPLATTRYLYGWIDFNNDGKFQLEELSDAVVSFSTIGASTQTLNWSAAKTSTLSTGGLNRYMRLRLSDRSLVDFTTTASGGAFVDERSIGNGSVSGTNPADYPTVANGEVEDYQIEVISTFDYGDVPVSYEQPLGSFVPARQLSNSTLYIGTQPDEESSAQSVAPETDNNGNNGDGLDEDGIDPIANPITVASVYSLPVKVTNTSGAARILHGWIDANNNGVFEAGEYASVSVANNTNGIVTLSWTAAITSNIKTSNIYLRLRLSSGILIDNVSTIGYDERAIADGTNVSGIYNMPFTGEIEDYRIIVNPGFDYGDAPASFEKNNLSVSVPARHRPDINLYLGDAYDTEFDSHSVIAGADNNNSNGDGIDEDGVVTPLPQLTSTTTSYSVNVKVYKTVAGTATLHGWIDMDGDGHFSTYEYATAIVTGTSGIQNITLTWSSPFYYSTGATTTYMRLRLTTATLSDNTSTPGIDERSIGYGVSSGIYGTTFLSGEVEDYALPVQGYIDSDGDGVPDYLDLDDDNDGILDCQENGFNGDPNSAFSIQYNANVPNTNIATGPIYQIQITPSIANQKGVAWTYGKIDFSQSFSFSMRAYLGSNTGGADGLAVVFQNSPSAYNAIGAAGNGLGARGIANGIALELDTYRNSGAPDSDPVYDHGTIRRTSDWAALSGTGQLSATSTNVKDGAWHTVTFYWSVVTKTLYYTFDGNQVATYTFPSSGTGSIINIFGGTHAYFGYTGSTGALINDQRVGFDDPCSIPIFVDTDGDGIRNSLDLDSDNDGCLDAIEGADNVVVSQLVDATNGLSVGVGSTASNQNLCSNSPCVDSQGVPLIVNQGAAGDVDGAQGQGIGSSQNAMVNACPTFCYKPGLMTGTALDSPVGITSLSRAGGSDPDNWPMVRKGGWLVLESKTKGFVVNRVSFDTTGNPVGIPTDNFVEGMMMYDITNNCMKMYTSTDDGNTFSWHCLSTQTCPD